MAIPDRLENKAAIEAAKAEILAAIAQTDGKLDVGVMAKIVKSIQRLSVKSESAKEPDKPIENKDITISAVNVDRTIVLSGGENSTSTPYAKLKNSTTVTVYTHRKVFTNTTGFYNTFYFPDVTVIEFY